jgi:hypothetical protein
MDNRDTDLLKVSKIKSVTFASALMFLENGLLWGTENILCHSGVPSLASTLKGQRHEIFDFRFLHESVSVVVDTGGKWKKSSISKFLII